MVASRGVSATTRGNREWRSPVSLSHHDHFASFCVLASRDAIGRADRQRLRAAGIDPAEEDQLVVGLAAGRPRR